MAKRVVSLVPSLSETIASWDIAPVACTRFCGRPDLEQVGGTKDPDVARIIALDPDVVLMDTEENRLEDHDALLSAGLEVHATSIRSVEDVDVQLATLAERLGTRWDPVAIHPAPSPRRSAFVPIWRRPWMALGSPTYATSLLGHLGIANIFADRGPYPSVTIEAASARHPDLVIAPDEPYPFGERHRYQLERVAPVVFVDGADLFWWGSRTPAAMEALGDVLSV